MGEEEVRVIRVTGCRQGKHGDCPHTTYCEPNNDGETLACVFCRGTLPQSGFPEWCPLPKEK